MARPKSVPTEELLKYLDEYILENGGAVPSIPQFGDFLRNKEIHINDFTLRRDKRFRNYYSEVSQKSVQTNEHDLVTYKSLDVSNFLCKNNTTEKLKQSLTTREQYYASIARKAVESINEKKKLEDKNKQLHKQISSLEMELEEAKKNSNRIELREKEKALLYIKNILNSYIYPDMANAILKKAGMSEVLSSVVPDELAEAMMIQANTDLSDLQKGSPVSNSIITSSNSDSSTKKESSTGFRSIDKLFGGLE